MYVIIKRSNSPGQISGKSQSLEKLGHSPDVIAFKPQFLHIYISYRSYQHPCISEAMPEPQSHDIFIDSSTWRK